MRWKHEEIEITADHRGKFCADVGGVEVKADTLEEARDLVHRARLVAKRGMRIDKELVLIHSKGCEQVTYRGASARSTNTLLVTKENSEKDEFQMRSKGLGVLQVGSEDATDALQFQADIDRWEKEIAETEKNIEEILDRNLLDYQSSGYSTNKTTAALDLHDAMLAHIKGWSS